MTGTPSPDITTPLVRTPDNQAALVPPLASLGALQALIGTWNSPPGAAATGYNVMSLPQQSAPNGYILKNFAYYEEITFATIAGNVANRGGDFSQTANTLFYEQRVYFADNPQPAPAAQVKDHLVHAENGMWLHLVYGPQQNGPYGPGTVPRNSEIVLQQPAATAYIKQVSVPHGNSILATGSEMDIVNGKPVFPSANRSILPFTDASVIDPNSKLQAQLDALAVKGVHVVSGTVIRVSSSPANGGNVADIPFEQRRATVSDFDTTWYIEQLSDGTTQLQYSQTIGMKLLINGVLTDFIHVDANTLVRAA